MWKKKKRKIEVRTILRLKTPLAFHLYPFPPFTSIIAQKGKETTTLIPADSRFQEELWPCVLFPGRKFPDIQPYIPLFSSQAWFISVLEQLLRLSIFLPRSCQVHYVIHTCLNFCARNIPWKYDIMRAKGEISDFQVYSREFEAANDPVHLKQFSYSGLE